MDVERTIEFILDHQAKLAAGMVELQSRQSQFQSQLDGLSSVVATVVTVQQSFAETMRQTQDQIRELTEAQKHTDERLHTLISIVDGIVRRPPKP